MFSIAITPPEIKNNADFWQVYEQALDLAIASGIDLPGELTFTWSEVEKRSFLGNISYQDEKTVQLIEILKRKKLPVVITIQPFETLNSRIPNDLRELPYDHPKVIERFKQFINWVYKTTNDLEAVAIVFGNEFDVHLAVQAANGHNNWQALENMVVQSKAFIKSLPRWQSVSFALESTFHGLTGPTWQELKTINQHADIIGVSYYPLSENTVDKPTILDQHLKDLFRVYPDKKFDFYQFGYPSSTKIGSSLEKQRQFIEETFKRWDQYNDRIRLITFTWLYDVQQPHIESMSAEVLGDISPTQAFQEFIGSLGLHSSMVGAEKPAFKELKKQVILRKWSE